jgi:hypothetical protein
VKTVSVININKLKQQAKSNFEKYGLIDAVLFASYISPESLQVCPLQIVDEENKQAIISFLTNEIRKNNLREYVLLTETWVTKIDKEKLTSETLEYVMMVHSSFKQEKVYMSEIKRNPDTLSDWEDIGTKNSFGKFLGLFKQSTFEWN